MIRVANSLRKKTVILSALLLFAAGGCVTVEKNVQPIEEENLHIVELKKAVSGLYMKNEEMNNRLFLMQEKLDTLEEESEESGGEDASGLKVDSLKDEEIDEESVFEEKVAESHSVLSDEDSVGEEDSEGPAEEVEEQEEPEAPLATAEELYEVAMKDLTGKNYAEARVNFQKLYENYPEHSLADNALYWTGETYYVERDYNTALESFEAVLNRYPDGNKAADSLLKTAYSYISLRDRKNTIKTLNILMEKYPDSEAAVKANERFRKKK